MKWSGRSAQRMVALVLATYGTTCHLCGRPGADTADHVVAQVHGGEHSLDNLRPAHGPCNYSRGSMSLAEWFDRHPLHAPPPPSRDWTAPPGRF